MKKRCFSSILLAMMVASCALGYPRCGIEEDNYL